MTETGLVVDGVHGIYAEAIVVTMAKDLGWDGPAWDVDDWERQWSVDEATEWLNECHAAAGYSFGWHEGDFFYLSDDEWEAML